MTQKEAIEEALRSLGGRARLQDIYTIAIELGDFSGSKDKKATIRNCLQKNPRHFRPSPDKPKGWWELTSFQEEIAWRDARIAELTAENEQLRAVKKEDDFVWRLVRETKNLYKHDKGKTEVVRQILYKVGRSDAEAELDAWIEGKEYIPTVNVSGDYVVTKNVENEVGHADKGATGININI